MIRHDLKAGTIWEGDWLQAPLVGGYAMAEVDGPFGMKKAAWDRMDKDGLADWYVPHLERLTSLMAPSSSVYLWNTAEGWARLDPVMRGLGWTSRALLTWNKGMGALAGRLDTEKIRCWPDVTEVCGVYQRDDWTMGTSAGNEIAHATGRHERNWIRPWLIAEWTRAGLKPKDADIACGTPGGMASRHYFPADQWWLPTWDAYKKLAAYAETKGAVGIFVKGGFPDLRSTYDHLRAECEAARCFFRLPVGVTNVWDHPQVSGSERLTGPDGQTLHPCQKPLLFAERMVQASTRPGDRIVIPFGGTCRIATYLERLFRTEPENARYHDTCELNADGKDYLGAVLGRMNDKVEAKAGQVPLFGGK